MSYQLKISKRKSQAGRFISKTHKELLKAFLFVSQKSGLTQQKLAEKLEMDRSTVNRILLGEGNLTLRTISDIAWALECDINITINPKQMNTNSTSNYFVVSKEGNLHKPKNMNNTSRSSFSNQMILAAA